VARVRLRPGGRRTLPALLPVALLLGCGSAAEVDPAVLCATLPACAPPATSAEGYGAPCVVAFGDGWRGHPVCCTGDVVAAACIPRGLGGEACDSTQALACASPLTCGTDPSCSGPCCVPAPPPP
jgi:hypothetical protein